MADDRDDEENGAPEERARDVSRRAGVKDAVSALRERIVSGWRDAEERATKTAEYWDAFNCKLGENQGYNGNSRIFLPIIHNAVRARAVRFTNQLFPKSSRHVEVVAANPDDTPYAVISLLEHYISRCRLRTLVAPALTLNGDIEGHYHIYVSWEKSSRDTVRRVEKPVVGEDGLENPLVDPVEDMEEERIEEGGPHVEVLSDADVLVLPAVSDTLEEAIEAGGCVVILRRWTKGEVKRKATEGLIRKEEGKKLRARLGKPGDKDGQVDQPKGNVAAAGIRSDGRGKYVQVYEIWTKLEIGGEDCLCQMFLSDEDILGCRRNPYWSDRLPLISAPLNKIAGAFKGVSPVGHCIGPQYTANDAVNMGMDSASYSLMPIVMTDPAKNPRVGTMILDLAAVWQTSPNDTKFVEFPQLWREAFQIVSSCKAEISQHLAVTPSQIPTGSGKKSSQADIAREQQVDILNTSDAVTVLEESVFSPLLERFLELDHQFRDDELLVRQYGPLGLSASLETIEPVQFDRRWALRWLGVDQARSAQEVQQQIAFLNVLRGIPPNFYQDYELDLTPVLREATMAIFGPRIAPLVLKKKAAQMPVPVEVENALLTQGFPLVTHPMDDDAAHVQAHAPLLATMQGSKKQLQEHITAHIQQAQRKAQGAAQPQGGSPGVPGGVGPGVAGTPRPGAQPGIPRVQGPPGMIHKDQLHDPGVMPRKM